jgi:hypothetical protein
LESDNGDNSEELRFDGDKEWFAASLDEWVFASSVTTMSSETAGSYSGFTAFTTVFPEKIKDITHRCVSDNKSCYGAVAINVA